jgi:hypothetical protein
MKQIANFSFTQNNGYIFVSSHNYNFIKDIKIFDSKGTLVLNKNNIISRNSKISTIDFKPGVYILILDSKGKNYSCKIVINN